MTNMRLINYRDNLLKRLEDPRYAAEYLAQGLAEKDSAAFLIALKDVVEAGGGVGDLAGRIGIKHPSLYKILSRKGNPTLETLQEILGPLGLRVSVAFDRRLERFFSCSKEAVRCAMIRSICFSDLLHEKRKQ